MLSTSALNGSMNGGGSGRMSNGSSSNGGGGSSRQNGTNASGGNGLGALKGREDVVLLKTIGTGTFARVYLCRKRGTDRYSALKILSKHEVIRLKQVEHVKNEKSILKEIQERLCLTSLTYVRVA